MWTTEIHPLETFKTYKYVVIFSKFEGKWLFSRHKLRVTWETQGGHIESGETPLAAAKRELYEESGARAFEITPVCDYWSGDEEDHSVGVVFLAHIHALGALPQSEMAQVCAFDKLPQALTYPPITPVLFDFVREWEKKRTKNA